MSTNESTARGVRRAAFDPTSPEKAVPGLASLLGALRALDGALDAQVRSGGARMEIRDRLAEEETDVVRALALAHGATVDAVADQGVVTAGRGFGVSVTIANEGPHERRIKVQPSTRPDYGVLRQPA